MVEQVTQLGYCWRRSDDEEWKYCNLAAITWMQFLASKTQGFNFQFKKNDGNKEASQEG